MEEPLETLSPGDKAAQGCLRQGVVGCGDPALVMGESLCPENRILFTLYGLLPSSFLLYCLKSLQKTAL